MGQFNIHINAMASVENGVGVLPETVLILTDRLKHGQNVVHILESQMDTAQQNIVLLQGQVRRQFYGRGNFTFEKSRTISGKIPYRFQRIPNNHNNSQDFL